MASYTEPGRALDFLLSEAPGTLSRDTITLAAGEGVLEAGTVLSQQADGTWVAYVEADTDTTDGPFDAAAVLCYETDATTSVSATAITRLAEVDSNLLVWADSNSATDQTLGEAQLAANFIIVR